MTRILLADDHELIRQGLRRILEQKREWVICGEAANGREAVAKARNLKPDVVVLDFAMPELNGLEAARQLRAALPETEILFLTLHDSDQLALAAWEAGARAYLLKTDVSRTLVAAIERLARHRSFVTPRLERLLAAARAGKPSAATAARPLTPREREILQLVAEGRSTKEVAEVLGISVKTAETHRTNLMRKLHLHSVSELVRYAIRENLATA
jgi:DNA-binding NarL/FixJ family response regulator